MDWQDGFRDLIERENCSCLQNCVAWADREKRALGEKGFGAGVPRVPGRPSKPSQGGSHSRVRFAALGFVHSAPAEREVSHTRNATFAPMEQPPSAIIVASPLWLSWPSLGAWQRCVPSCCSTSAFTFNVTSLALHSRHNRADPLGVARMIGPARPSTTSER